MRFIISLPEDTVDKLLILARKNHRHIKQHAEFILCEAVEQGTNTSREPQHTHEHEEDTP